MTLTFTTSLHLEERGTDGLQSRGWSHHTQCGYSMASPVRNGLLQVGYSSGRYSQKHFPRCALLASGAGIPTSATWRALQPNTEPTLSTTAQQGAILMSQGDSNMLDVATQI